MSNVRAMYPIEETNVRRQHNSKKQQIYNKDIRTILMEMEKIKSFETTNQLRHMMSNVRGIPTIEETNVRRQHNAKKQQEKTNRNKRNTHARKNGTICNILDTKNRVSMIFTFYLLITKGKHKRKTQKESVKGKYKSATGKCNR